ncbi:MAG: type II toxin-antitoxin system VapC family toxin [Rhodothermales bacterium]
MKLLLDTHALIFLLSDPDRLSSEAREAMQQTDEIAFSAASIWEIEIKAKIGKLAPPATSTLQAARMLGLVELPMMATHAEQAGRLPLHHADPFDRMLIAQAQVEGYALVSRDQALVAYAVTVQPC